MAVARASFGRRRTPVYVLAGVGLLVATSAVAQARDDAGEDLRLPPIRTTVENVVPACATPERLMRYLRRFNPNVEPRFAGIAEAYRVVGTAYGVRWDFAFFQMMLETSSLSFRSARGAPLYLRPEQNNFGGLGAVDQSRPGERFPDVTAGVQAHIEHTLIYAGRRIANPVAERTRNVQAWRVLDTWHAEFDRPITFRDLALRWNPFSTSYAQELARIARVFFETNCPGIGASWRVPLAATETASERPQGMQVSTAWVARNDDIGGPAATPSEQASPPSLVPPKPRLVERTPGARLPPPPTPRRPTANERMAALAPVRPPLATAPRPGQPTRPPPWSAPRKPEQAKPRPEPKSKPRVSRDDRVRNLVSGRLVHLKADMGAIIPVRFNRNGRMRGEAGNLAFFLGAARDRGRWWVDKGLLCKKWNVWLSGRTMCLTLDQRGKTVHWRSRDGRSGTATIVR